MIQPHPYPSHRSKRLQRRLERACDAVLDQILDWPVIPWGEVDGGRPGKPMGRYERIPAPRISRADPSLERGIRIWTDLEMALYVSGVSVR